MNTLKFLAFLRGYITCIFQALVKHRYSTDIVLFTQLLRKQIYKGKTYFRSTCLVRRNCWNKRGSSAFLLTNFALSSALVRAGHRSCMHVSSGFLRVDPMKSRCRPDENPMNGRSWSGVGRYLSIPLSYRECTEKVLKRYRRATKKLLEIYQRCTKQLHAFGSSIVKLGYKLRRGSESSLRVVCGRSVRRTDAYRLNFGDLQASCAVLMGKDESLVARKKSNVLNALKCVGQFGGYRKAFRMSLACVFLVSMFSLSAQTPRKDSGADGLSDLVALKPGDKIPDAVWNQPLELNYFNGKKKTIKFADLKGKLILLDFWSTGCPSCIENIPHMEDIQKRYPKGLSVLLVNSKRNKDTPSRIKLVLDRYKEKYNFEIKLMTILEDTMLTNLFPHNTIPNIAWINQDGVFLGNTLPDEVGLRNIETILENKTADLQLRSEFLNKDKVMDTPPIFDTAGVKFLSAITGYLPDYLPTYPNVIHKNGNSSYQMLNAAFNFMLVTAFKDELRGFENTDYVFENGQKDKIQKMLFGGSRREYQYCYQLFVDDTISSSKANRYFQQAFKDYFRLNVERKRGRISFYSVGILDNISSLKSKGGIPQVNINPEDGPIYFQNYPLINLLRLLHLYVDLPVTFGPPQLLRIDLRMPEGFIYMSTAEKLTFLETKGIMLTLHDQEKEYPYISRIY